MEIEIEIFYHSDETLILDKNDVEYSILECDTKYMTFYDIHCISPFEDEKSKEMFCRIYSGSTYFIATKSYEEIKKLIREKGFAHKD